MDKLMYSFNNSCQCEDMHTHTHRLGNKFIVFQAYGQWNLFELCRLFFRVLAPTLGDLEGEPGAGVVLVESRCLTLGWTLADLCEVVSGL